MHVRHRHDRRHGEDLARVGQRQQQAAAGAFDGQPGRRARLVARRLQPVGEPGLQVAQGFLVATSAGG